MIAWPLLVVSAEAQREDLADHLRMARADAERNGWTLERVGDFEDVATGKYGVRDPMVRLVAEIANLPEAARPQWVWMRRVDRAGRGKATESTLALQTLRGYGVRIWDHDRGEVDPGSVEGELVTFVLALQARIENQGRAGKMRAVHARQKATGKPVGFRRPYGLAWSPAGDVAVPELAEAVRQAFAWRIEGLGLQAIGRRLLALAPPQQFKDHAAAVRWSNKRVARLLRNRAYVGPIIDEVTWQRAQRAAVAVGWSKRANDYLFRGSLRCWCGRRMSGGSAGRRSTGYVYRFYRCDARWAHGGVNRQVPAAKLEAQFGELLASITVSPALQSAYRRAQQAVPSAALVASALIDGRKRLAALEQARTSAWDLHLAGKIGDDELGPRLAHLKAEHERLTAELAELAAQEQLIGHARQIERDALAQWERAATAYPRASQAEREELARMVATHFGLCCEPDGALTLRRPIDPGRQNRQALR